MVSRTSSSTLRAVWNFARRVVYSHFGVRQIDEQFWRIAANAIHTQPAQRLDFRRAFFAPANYAQVSLAHTRDPFRREQHTGIFEMLPARVNEIGANGLRQPDSIQVGRAKHNRGEQPRRSDLDLHQPVRAE